MDGKLKRRIRQSQINFKLFKRGLISKEFFKNFSKKTQNMVNCAKA